MKGKIAMALVLAGLIFTYLYLNYLQREAERMESFVWRATKHRSEKGPL